MTDVSDRTSERRSYLSKAATEDGREWVWVGIAFQCHPRVHSTNPETWSWWDIVNGLLAGHLGNLQTIGGTNADVIAATRNAVVDEFAAYFKCESRAQCGKNGWTCGNCQVIAAHRTEDTDAVG